MRESMTYSKQQQEPLFSHSRKGREVDAALYYEGGVGFEIE